jgi:hypothetical protein
MRRTTPRSSWAPIVTPEPEDCPLANRLAGGSACHLRRRPAENASGDITAADHIEAAA